jgi:hypothetical protein
MAILNKQKCLFSKMDKKVKQVLPVGWYQWEGEEYKEMGGGQ